MNPLLNFASDRPEDLTDKGVQLQHNEWLVCVAKQCRACEIYYGSHHLISTETDLRTWQWYRYELELSWCAFPHPSLGILAIYLRKKGFKLVTR